MARICRLTYPSHTIVNLRKSGTWLFGAVAGLLARVHVDGRRLENDARKLTTHNAFFVTPDQRDAKLTETFNVFQRRPEVIGANVARFRSTHARLFE
jgi:hypothetical protein